MISFQTYNIAANPRISVAEAKSTHGWNIVFRRNLNDWELQSVAELWETLEAFQGLTEEEDVLMWKSHKSGAFSVKIAYHFINTIANPTQGWPWKQIWRVRVPKKVLCFTWLVAREAVLTQNNLIRRGIQLHARCSLCGKDGESVSHLFIPISLYTVRSLLNFGITILIWLKSPGQCPITLHLFSVAGTMEGQILNRRNCGK